MPTAWLEARVEVPQSLAEGVANVLIELGSPGLTSEEAGERVALLAYYESDQPLDDLRRYLTDVSSTADISIHTRWIGSEDWAENWKVHFPPVDIGRRFHVCPPWRVSSPPGRIAIVIHPGMAFGTGHHATTAGCLELIERQMPQAVAGALDVGSGSGILSIALVKLGVPRVVAVDVDPLARAATADNALRNGVRGALAVVTSVDEVAGGPFPLVVANLQLGVLRDLEPLLRSLTEAGGVWIASGLLQADTTSFRDVWEPSWSKCDGIVTGEWASLALRRKP